MVALMSFLYSIVLPTNVLFAAAGLSGTGLRCIPAVYWLARSPIDTALVWTAELITREVLVDSYRNPITIALQIMALGLFPSPQTPLVALANDHCTRSAR
jgi:hypothetical protein